jgi:penicillin-binding protein 2
MAFLGQQEQLREFQDRFRFLYAAVFVGFILLTSRLVYLQVLEGERNRKYSEDNRIKRVKVVAPRGMIFDRNMKLLIDNRPAFDLEIIPQYFRQSKEAAQSITRLSKILKIPESQIEETLRAAKNQASFLPVKIKTDLSRDEVAEVESWKIEMPGVEVRQEIKRTNVFGEVGSHLLGFIGEVNALELPKLNKGAIKYKQSDNIGKFGLEQKMENILRGVDGEELKEVDANGRIKLEKGRSRSLGTQVDRPAIPGRNLILTIDQDLQLAASTAFGEKIGSMVAIDPRNGEILAMLSRPGFDSTEFSRGISTTTWNRLINNENRPLGDKTIMDHYPPGSTFKVFTAIAGLEEGVIDENTKFHCSGSIRVGNRSYRCWQRHGHGELNVVGAIQKSCDVFFYRVAQRLKSVDDLHKWATRLGLGRKTGIPLAREVPGLIPTEAWKQKALRQAWNPGETLHAAIGQGFVLSTAIQLANAYASLANGGTLYRPHIVNRIETYDGKVESEFPPEIMDSHRLKPKTVELVKRGLWNVINLPGGTGYAHRLPGMDFVGKTGTAQVIGMAGDKIYSKCENMRYRDRHHGLFVGFAPLQNPVIAVAVIGEHVCHGTTSIPIVRAVIKTYLEKYFPEKYGEKVLAARLKKEGQSAFVPRSAPVPPSEDEEVPIEPSSATPHPPTLLDETASDGDESDE